MGVEHLDVVIPVRLERDKGSRDDHPMRKVTREVAFDPSSWTAERRAFVAEIFDGEAPNWHTRETPGRYDALGTPSPAATSRPTGRRWSWGREPVCRPHCWPGASPA